MAKTTAVADQVDWRDIEDDREKYQAYLCSREWAKLKTAVHERADGVCERCGLFKIGAVHHLTYARQYAERLEDLAGWCVHCHNFTHDKHWMDPKVHEAFIRVMYNHREFQLAGDVRQPAPFEAFEHRDALRDDIVAILGAIDDIWGRFCSLPHDADSERVQKLLLTAGFQLPFMYLPPISSCSYLLDKVASISPYRKTDVEQAQFIAGRFGFEATAKQKWLQEPCGDNGGQQ